MSCLTELQQQVRQLQQQREDTTHLTLGPHDQTVREVITPAQPTPPVPTLRATGLLVTPENTTEPPRLRGGTLAPPPRRQQQEEGYTRYAPVRDDRDWPVLPPPQHQPVRVGRQRETYNNRNNTIQRRREDTDTLSHKLFQIAQIDRASATWKKIPSRLADKIAEFEDLLTPPMPDDQFKVAKSTLMDDMKSEILKLVNNHLQLKKQQIKTTLGKMRNCTTEGINRAKDAAESKMIHRFNGKISVYHTRRSLEEATGVIGTLTGLPAPIQQHTVTQTSRTGDIPLQNRYAVLAVNDEEMEQMDSDNINEGDRTRPPTPALAQQLLPDTRATSRSPRQQQASTQNRSVEEAEISGTTIYNNNNVTTTPTPTQPQHNTVLDRPRDYPTPTHNNDGTRDTAPTRGEQEISRQHEVQPTLRTTSDTIIQTPGRCTKRTRDTISPSTAPDNTQAEQHQDNQATGMGDDTGSPPVTQPPKKNRADTTSRTETLPTDDIPDEELWHITNIMTVADEAATATFLGQRSNSLPTLDAHTRSNTDHRPTTADNNRASMTQLPTFRKSVLVDQDFKQPDSKLNPTGDRSVLMIADSQMRNAGGFPGDWEVLVCPGMNTQHAYTTIKNTDWTKYPHIQTIVVHVGINNRRWSQETNYIEVSKLYSNLRNTEKNYSIVGVSIPPNLPPHEEMSLRWINDELARKAAKEQHATYIEPLPTYQVRVAVDDKYKIHYNTDTLKKLCDLIVCSFPRPRPLTSF